MTKIRNITVSRFLKHCAMNVIVCVPSEVMGEILGKWLDLKSVAQLDSAACNADFLPALHDLFASKHVTYSCDVYLHLWLVRWLHKRKIKVTKLELNSVWPELTKYMQKNSSRIQSVKCTSETALTTVTFYCRNVKSLICSSLLVTYDLEAFLWSNRNLHELVLHKVSGLRASHFEGLALPQLSTIALRFTYFDDVCLSAIVRMSDIVQEMDLFGAKQITDAGVISVGQSCPMLTSLGLGACRSRMVRLHS